MDRIIVEVWVPAIDNSFDFEVPAQMTVEEFLQAAIPILEASTQNVRFDDKVPLLCDQEANRILEGHQYLSDAGIRDAHRLMIL